MKLIRLDKVNKIYHSGAGDVTALQDINLSINQGEMVAIVGHSGSGKSTLMNILGCLDTPTSGVYTLQGQSIATLGDRSLSTIRNRTIGFVFQKFHLISGLTAWENVEMPLMYRGISGTQRHKLASESLERVGLADRMRHRPSEMSGGQQQRVAIARAIAGKPPLILADEPTGNLDSKSGREIIRILQQLHGDGHTVILITHDSSIASSADRIIEMDDGRITKDSSVIDKAM